MIYILSGVIPKLIRTLYPMKYEDTISKYAVEYGLDIYLIAAIIKVESNFDTLARSNKGALGLMQIKASTGKWIGEKLGINDFEEEMLYQPEMNIKMGCWYLNYLLKYYDGNIQLALAAYNGGLGNVNKWLKDERCSEDGVSLKYIPFEETSTYIKKISKAYNIYKRIYSISN
ncbi:lytic transglycosylase domain-containing protein [Lutispora thermophila]